MAGLDKSLSIHLLAKYVISFVNISLLAKYEVSFAPIPLLAKYAN